LALSFWPIYAARFAVEGIGVLFWEFVVMAFMAFFAQLPAGHKGNAALVLGLLTGMGFYVHLHWPFVALAIFLFVVHYEKEEPGQRLFWKFLIPVVLLPLPLIFAAANNGYGNYLLSLFVSDHKHPLGYRISSMVSFFTSLFWGADSPLFAYKPLWGGFLNPIAGAFFWVGVVELWFQRDRWPWRWAGWCFLIFMLPGLLSNNLELFRIVTLIPLLCVVIAAGVIMLVRSFDVSRRFLFVVPLLLLSVSLDFYHLFGPYHAIWQEEPQKWASYSKSREGWQALRVFERETQEKGPGYIFCEFDALPFDRSLVTGVRSIDAHYRSRAQQDRASWIGIVTNSNYRSFLSKRFSGSRWIDLDRVPSSIGGLSVVIIPLTLEDRSVVRRWTEAEKVLSDTTYDLLNLGWLHDRKGIVAELLKNYQVFKGDPFLESIFWDLVYLNSCMDQNLRDSEMAIRLAIQRGYPTGYFYNELGSLMTIEKNYPAARAAFEKAVASPGNKTAAKENIKVLEEQKVGDRR
jgi:hypothetical protein